MEARCSTDIRIQELEKNNFMSIKRFTFHVILTLKDHVKSMQPFGEWKCKYLWTHYDNVDNL